MCNRRGINQGGIVIIALGSNLSSSVWGAPRSTLRRALDELAASGIQILSVSRTYDTLAHSHAPQPNFLNAVVATETSMSADNLLQVLKAIEARAGRDKVKKAIPLYYQWQPRPLDLDIISYKGRVWNWRLRRPLAHRRVILPHPRAHERAFVLRPISEIAPAWHHPVFGLTAEALLKRPPVRDTGKILNSHEFLL
jgi:2-amino-4-hydroxy-6-hydroxymethyldihydropteridine diphosphokinase